jgi:glutaredoxin
MSDIKNDSSDYVKLINNNNNGIFIISKENCPLCVNLKELFDTISVNFTNFKYDETEYEKNNEYPFKSEMKKQTGGKMFPFCYFNGKYVGSYKEIHHNLITGKLQEQLNEIGIEYEEDF